MISMSRVPGKTPAVTFPPQVRHPRELLLETLGKLLTAEETLLKRVLPQLAREIQDDELKAAVQEHLQETRGHVGNLQRAFLALGEVPEGRPAPGLDGLVAERESRVSDVMPALRAGFDCAAAMGTEHYEINGYEAAIRLADALGSGKDGSEDAGAEEVARLLRATLEQEIAALEKLGANADRLATLAVRQPTADI
jgi:ferritin-like metal-binding protein YciE